MGATHLLRRLAPLLLGLAAIAASDGSPPAAAPAPESRPGPAYARQAPFVERTFRPFRNERWIGEAIAYGPHRDGQFPGGPSPTKDQVREDLRLMSGRWSLLRLYGSAGPAESILAVIHEDRIPMNVMLGVWISPEDRRDSIGGAAEGERAAAANRLEIESAVRLASRYSETVIAVSVGNETQIDWSSHRVPAPLLVGAIREIRARTSVPVTTADDFNFWNKPESRGIASELDFLVTHLHPLWNGLQPGEAVAWTRSRYAELRAFHPGRAIVIGETGWATGKLPSGEQGKLMKGAAGEEEQAAFCLDLAAWARRERIPTFFFEAFDENWKGGPESGDAEKHWGFYRADRTPKRVVLAGEGSER